MRADDSHSVATSALTHRIVRNFWFGLRLFHKPSTTGSSHNARRGRPHVTPSEGHRGHPPSDLTPWNLTPSFVAHNGERGHGLCETASAKSSSAETALLPIPDRDPGDRVARAVRSVLRLRGAVSEAAGLFSLPSPSRLDPGDDLIRRLCGALVLTAAVGCAISSSAAGHGSRQLQGPAIATNARDCNAVAWRSERDGDQYCPRYHSMLSDFAYSRIRWSSWGGPAANGTGAAICTHPSARYCGRSAYQTYAIVAIRLSRPTTCSDGTRIYTRILVRTIRVFPGGGPPGKNSWGYTCSGSGERGGGG